MTYNVQGHTCSRLPQKKSFFRVLIVKKSDHFPGTLITDLSESQLMTLNISVHKSLNVFIWTNQLKCR